MNAIPLSSERTRAMTPRNHDLNFMEFLTSFRRGELLADADQKLSDLVEALALHHGAGSITIKLAFKVNKAGQIEVNPDIALKKPVRALGTGIYFASDAGRLTRRDPNQMDIEDEIARRSGDNT